ncbi:SCO family protein [Spiribacter vilamensis]|nr:SCO family protein [Spiribacter vilamensis]
MYLVYQARQVMKAAGNGIMDDMMARQKFRLFALVAVVAAVIAGVVTAFWPQAETGSGADSGDAVGTVLPEARELPSVTLTNDEGERWTNAALEGEWQYLFFGFTNCPDVCPLTLATLAGALDRLDESDAEVIPEVVFVSVDPQRDKPAAIKTYLEHFHDDFIGVTGERAAIDRLTGALGISYKLHEPDSNGDYAVDHSAAILLIDPRGRLRALWQPPHGRDVLADEFRQIRQQFPTG